MLLAVAQRRRVLFWYGFLLLSGADAFATYLYLTDQVGKISPWTIEAMLVPFGLVSIPIIAWCVKHWPIATQTPPSQTEPAVPTANHASPT